MALRRPLCRPAASSCCSCSCRSHHLLPHRAALPSPPGFLPQFPCPLLLRLSLYFRRSTINLSVRLLCLVLDRKSTRLNSSHSQISYAVFCLKKKNHHHTHLLSYRAETDDAIVVKILQ